MANAIRHLGTCPVCQAEFKARTTFKGPVLVHHGFKRPGHGSIVGDCFGVAYLAYETSYEGCVAYSATCASMVTDLEGFLAKLEAREIPYLVQEEVHYCEVPSRKRMYDFRKLYRDDPLEAVAYEGLRRHRIEETKHRIAGFRSEIERMRLLVETWVSKPVKEWSEEIEATVKKADRDARAAVLAEKRAAKAAETARKQAKAADLKARRQAVLDELAGKFRALANSPESLADRKAGARNLAYTLRAKKYAWLYYGELKCDDALVTLGLAVRFPNGHTVYRTGA